VKTATKKIQKKRSILKREGSRGARGARKKIEEQGSKHIGIRKLRLTETKARAAKIIVPSGGD